jgi:multidrug resistance efflux pump
MTKALAPILCTALALLAAQAPAQAVGDTFFGTVRASDMAGLSYNARGCIVAIDEAAKQDRMVQAGTVLVRLDDARAQLALRTAQARVAELEAQVKERELAITAAEADGRRRAEELEFVSEEYQRNSIMLGRGLINETAMEAVERRFMDANFTAERAQEAIDSALAAKQRAEIALEIGRLDLESAELGLEDLTLTAPIDGVLLGFEPNLGDCVQEGERAGQVYAPDRKSVDVYLLISRLSSDGASGMAIGAPVRVKRVNGDVCGGRITRVDSEADLENQFVEATIDVDRDCAQGLFLNEAVEVETMPEGDG